MANMVANEMRAAELQTNQNDVYISSLSNQVYHTITNQIRMNDHKRLIVSILAESKCGYSLSNVVIDDKSPPQYLRYSHKSATTVFIIPDTII